MDASRLLEVLDDVDAESQDGYLAAIKAIVQAYNSARDNATTDNSGPINEALQRLMDVINGGRFVNYPPTKKRILSEIGGDALVGPAAYENLRYRLEQVVAGAAALAATASSFQTEFVKFRDAASSTKSGLRAIGIRPHSLKEGEHEVNVLLPSSMTSGTLTGLAKQTNKWNIAIRGFAQAVQDAEPELRVKDVGNGSVMLSVVAGLGLVTLVCKVIKDVTSTYASVLDVKLKRLVICRLSSDQSFLENNALGVVS